MSENTSAQLLLGRNTPVVEAYSPQILFPIPRSDARSTLGLSSELPFYGADLWHAYELSWLNSKGWPVARVGRFVVPADSPCIVESKSFKLYLNSLNSMRFESDAAARALIEADVAAIAGAPVSLSLHLVSDPVLAGATLRGTCLDELGACDSETDAIASAVEPSLNMLRVGESVVEEELYCNLLRSLCPVTGQPDWATLWIHYRGFALDQASLLRYIIAYRQHQEYHEQCVERIFTDLSHVCAPDFLHVQAYYTRRGGMDINPFRSTDPLAQPRARLNRQ